MMASNDFMYTLAWSLLHFVWQGAAIAALAAATLFVVGKPAARYLVGVGALALMLVSFAVTFALLSGTPAADYLPAGAPAAALASPAHASGAAAAIAGPRDAAFPDDSFLWLARAWLAGVFLLALRVAFGLLWVERLRRRNLLALPAALVARCRALQARLGIRRVIQYRECHLVGVPAVIGFFRPVVLLPMRALTGLSAEQLDAVIAHELGHIKRFDVLVNFFQVVAETLFFFHPAVWWLSRRVRAERENCCDDLAVAACGGQVGYARALATMAGWHALPFAMSATGGAVAARVARLLGVDRGAPGARTAGMFTASLVLVGALAAGLASIGVATPAAAQSASEEPRPVVAQADVPAVSEVPEISSQPAARPQPAARAEPAAPARPATPARPAKPPKPLREPAPASPPSPAAEPAKGASFIEEMRRAGYDEIDVDHLVAMRAQEITPEYVREMRAAGFQPDAGELIAMKVHDVTAEYVRAVRALGFKPDAGEIIALKAQGVEASYVKALRDAGVDMDAGEIVALKIQGVTPEYVRDVRTLGFDPDAGDIVALKVQGVDAAYVKAMREIGIDLDVHEIVGLKVQGVTPEYVKRMRAAGLDADAHQFIAMKVHDVTPELARAFESAGYHLNVEQLIHAKVMDVTPAFIEKARAHGFKDLNIEKLIHLKHADVL